MRVRAYRVSGILRHHDSRPCPLCYLHSTSRIERNESNLLLVWACSFKSFRELFCSVTKDNPHNQLKPRKTPVLNPQTFALNPPKLPRPQNLNQTLQPETLIFKSRNLKPPSLLQDPGKERSRSPSAGFHLVLGSWALSSEACLIPEQNPEPEALNAEPSNPE